MARPFVWFDPAAVQLLRTQLGAASPDAWLEVHEEGKHTTLYVREPGQGVVTESHAGGGGINDAHVCPPEIDCPPA